MLAFLLQKKRQFLFDESDDEEMTNLFKATTSSSTAVERSSKAEDAWVDLWTV